MGRTFDIPLYYRSPVVSRIKNSRRVQDHRKQDLSPTELKLGGLCFKLARHFGFCYGVENAIEIAYRALSENPNNRVFLLSEMIHNPHVNADLLSRGVRFILSPDGNQLVPFDQLRAEDIVIVPAFGTSVELFKKLEELGINPTRYNATCPFVEKVWKRAAQLGDKGFTVIIHGKHAHEETRATFSHARLNAPSIVVRDIDEAKILAGYIEKQRSRQDFEAVFSDRCSQGFDPDRDLNRIGVVNQTTMLAGETQSISNLLRESIKKRYGTIDLEQHFADTRDTLCYATTENQDAISGLISSGGDIAIVVGGYNSSNTSHLVELLSPKVPTFYIKDAGEIVDVRTIRHLDLHKGEVVTSHDWIPERCAPQVHAEAVAAGRQTLEVLITAGASCPDILVDQVVQKISSFYRLDKKIEQVLGNFDGIQ